MEYISQAIKILNDGGIVIYPTDTAFGIGCRIDNPAAIERLFRLRKRPLSQAMSMLVDSESMALVYYFMPTDIVRHLMKKYWPGALTIVAPCKKELVYSPIRGGGESVGIRCPNHATTLSIIDGIGVPMLGPSANFHGEATPYRFEDLSDELVSLVDFVVPGQCTVGLASTVVDCSQDPYSITRQGSVELP